MSDQGYPDFQRVVNWDSALIVDGVINAQPDTVTDLGFVGRYSYLAFWVNAPSIPVTFQVGFYADKAKTKTVGIRRLAMDPNVTEPLQFKVPCIGPWATLDVSSISGANASLTVRAFGTNRAGVPESWPRYPTMLDVNTVGLNTGSSASFYFAGYWDGPLGCYLLPLAAAMTFDLAFMDLGGVYRSFCRVAPAANVPTYLTAICPLAPCRLDASNLSGVNGQVLAHLTPSLTGG